MSSRQIPRSGIARSNVVTVFKSLETHCPVERMVVFTPTLAEWCVHMGLRRRVF